MFVKETAYLTGSGTFFLKLCHNYQIGNRQAVLNIV